MHLEMINISAEKKGIIKGISIICVRSNFMKVTRNNGRAPQKSFMPFNDHRTIRW